MATIEKHLPRPKFFTVIRWIKTVEAERVKALVPAVAKAMERLSLVSDPTKVVAGVPAGSDQFDNGSVNTWLDKIGPGDRRAKRQVIALDATLRSRLGG